MVYCTVQCGGWSVSQGKKKEGEGINRVACCLLHAYFTRGTLDRVVGV